MSWSNSKVHYKKIGCKRMFIKFVWRRIGTCSDFLYEETKTLAFHKVHIIYRMDELH